MKLFFKFFVFLLFFIFSNFSFLYANELKAVYLIEVGTINIGNLIWNIKRSDNNYKISIAIKRQGFFVKCIQI